jgi:hypothetical protein
MSALAVSTSMATNLIGLSQEAASFLDNSREILAYEIIAEIPLVSRSDRNLSDSNNGETTDFSENERETSN